QEPHRLLGVAMPADDGVGGIAPRGQEEEDGEPDEQPEDAEVGHRGAAGSGAGRGGGDGHPQRVAASRSGSTWAQRATPPLSTGGRPVSAVMKAVISSRCGIGPTRMSRTDQASRSAAMPRRSAVLSAWARPVAQIASSTAEVVDGTGP